MLNPPGLSGEPFFHSGEFPLDGTAADMKFIGDDRGCDRLVLWKADQYPDDIPGTLGEQHNERPPRFIP